MVDVTENGSFFSKRLRDRIAQASFVLFVILVPVWVGFAWNQHQRTDDLAQINAKRRTLLVESCERGNTIRRQFRVLVKADREQAALLIDYMNLDIASKRPAPTIAEHLALHRLTTLYAQAKKVSVLPIIDCEGTIK